MLRLDDDTMAPVSVDELVDVTGYTGDFRCRLVRLI